VCWAIGPTEHTLSDFDQVDLFNTKYEGQSRNPASLRLLTKCTREPASGTTSRRRTPFTHLQQFGYYLDRSFGATLRC
jgi:hypothetical protein